MQLNRRTLLKTLGALLPGLLPVQQAGAASNGEFSPERCFSALIDTYIPADQAPGALDLDIDTQLFKQITRNPKQLALVNGMLQQLDHLALAHTQKAFAQLSLADRNRLVTQIFESQDPADGGARAQLATLRNSALTLFYVSDEAFQMLAYHPPSMGGYPDYAAPLR